MRDTFVNLVAFSFRWAKGELAHRLTVATAGMVPDAIADAARQVMRMMLPLDGSMPDALPSMFRRFGLPPYGEDVTTYFLRLSRLQNMLDTHSRAGSVDQLLEECAFIGIPNPVLEATDRGFYIGTTDGSYVVSENLVGDTWILGDDTYIGVSLPLPQQNRSVLAMIEYFKPAADLFEGVKEL